MNQMNDGVCPECGAPLRDGYRCRDYFDALIAREFENVFGAGAVHFHTVACYQLQHPQSFTLTAEACSGLWESLADVVERDVPLPIIMRRTRQRVNGPTRVRANVAIATPSVAWAITAADIFFAEPAHHVELVLAWARTMLAAGPG